MADGGGGGGRGVFTVTVRVLRSSYNHICCHYEHSGRPRPGSKPALQTWCSSGKTGPVSSHLQELHPQAVPNINKYKQTDRADANCQHVIDPQHNSEHLLDCACLVNTFRLIPLRMAIEGLYNIIGRGISSFHLEKCTQMRIDCLL